MAGSRVGRSSLKVTIMLPPCLGSEAAGAAASEAAGAASLVAADAASEVAAGAAALEASSFFSSPQAPSASRAMIDADASKLFIKSSCPRESGFYFCRSLFQSNSGVDKGCREIRQQIAEHDGTGRD